jgi:hypothetical protein
MAALSSSVRSAGALRTQAARPAGLGLVAPSRRPAVAVRAENKVKMRPSVEMAASNGDPQGCPGLKRSIGTTSHCCLGPSQIPHTAGASDPAH